MTESESEKKQNNARKRIIKGSSIKYPEPLEEDLDDLKAILTLQKKSTNQKLELNELDNEESKENDK